ncbi:unnamed protein product [Rhizoctonia solani]|uniref:Uncharacterized protein n=1 Tax=Rhizoctonia solani TaxID=456999 RepID=A0A8H2XG77_9AGAM|nr:unnamed protein product [Rhizoctonia solani]
MDFIEEGFSIWGISVLGLYYACHVESVAADELASHLLGLYLGVGKIKGGPVSLGYHRTCPLSPEDIADMVSLSFKVIAAIAAAAAVQASEHELEVRDWEARRLAPRNFELITTKLTLLVPKGSYKTVTKYKTVTVSDCGAGGTTITDTFPTPTFTDTFTTPTDTATTPTDTFTVPTDTFTTPTDTFTIPTATDTSILTTPTDTGIPTGTLTDAPTATGAPTTTETGIPTGTDTFIGGGLNTTTDPLATPTTPIFGNTTTDPTGTIGVAGAGANATNDPFATTTTATIDPFATSLTTTAADPAASLDIFGPSTETEDVTVTTDPTAPTPTAPSVVLKRAAQVI